jgi:nucleoside-diphosphate-sugar epimerase
MASYLVTGGAGFIGSNLVKRLVSDGHTVRVLDNYRAGKFSKRFVEGVEYMEGDLRNEQDVKKSVVGVDGIFHLAAIPRMSYSIEHPEETNEVNVGGTLRLLVAAKEAGVKRFVFSSSSSVYGGCEIGKELEENMKVNPMSPYGLQKFVGEEYCRLFSLLYGFSTISLRYFNVYGPMMDPNGGYALVMGKFLRQKHHGEPMSVCGDGEFYRDYTHVEDVVEANILAMKSTSIQGGDVFNIGYGEPHSVNEIVEIFGGDYEFVPERSGDPRWTKANNGKAKQVLGWIPKISMKEGLEKLTFEMFV